MLNFDTTMTGPELVQWYVLHSEYKDMNGKRGPDWFDWREGAEQRKREEREQRRLEKERRQKQDDDKNFWA